MLFSVKQAKHIFINFVTGFMMIITVRAMVQEKSSVTAKIQVRVNLNFKILNVYCNLHQTHHYGIPVH
jgi:hypothetical protein